MLFEGAQGSQRRGTDSTQAWGWEGGVAREGFPKAEWAFLLP